MIDRLDIPDSYVEQALSLDQSLLEPGNEQAAIAEIANGSLGDKHPVDSPQLWALSASQMAEFAEDFNAPTITHYKQPADHALSRYAALQLGIATSIGRPFGLVEQRAGVVVQDLFPRDDLLHRANSGFGAYIGISPHSDQSYNPDVSEVPDHIMLSAIRNNEKAPTQIAYLPTVLKALSAKAIQRLCQPDFIFFRGRPEENQGARTGPVLTETADDTVIRMSTDIWGIDLKAGRALDELYEAIESATQWITLNPGETLILPNNTALHGRPGFTPDAVPERRRWLQRIYVGSAQ